MTCPECNGVGYSDGRNSRYAAYFELCATCGATGELPQQLPQTESLAEPGENAIVTGATSQAISYTKRNAKHGNNSPIKPTPIL